MRTPQHEPFTFIDLFAGIGGFHIAMHQLGGECVCACEWNEQARKTYEYNFREISPLLFKKGLFRGDIQLECNQRDIPYEPDILCAGFPCQPFSQAGYKQGFSETRGVLFFEIAKIIRDKRPKTIFLENVRHLLHHNNGETFKKIQSILEEDLGYTTFHKIMKPSEYGLPTYRPRIFIIGFREDIKAETFEFPSQVPLRYNMSDIFSGDCPKEVGYTLRVGGRGSGIHDRRNWDSYVVNGEVHVITTEEAKKMMGFPPGFSFPVSEAQALKQLGNSIAIDPVRMTAQSILHKLHKGMLV